MSIVCVGGKDMICLNADPTDASTAGAIGAVAVEAAATGSGFAALVTNEERGSATPGQ